MQDPNFPPNLSIKPYSIGLDDSNATAQAGAIDKYGIAGRVWEAGKPLLEYFTPGKDFDPACSLFSGGHQCVVELGSGQSVPSLRLASYLTPADLIVLTDLPNVVPLCHQAVKAHVGSIRARVVVEPLAWGEDASRVKRLGPFTHILCCDLIYFPHLYPSLLLTLLDLTESDPSEEDTFGPEVILAYQSRSLALEHSFFDAFELYFRMQPVLGRDWEGKIYICKRWRVTPEWVMPNTTTVMNGSDGVIRGRSFGLIDELFGSIDY